MINQVTVGHCLEVLKRILANSVHCCVTSPPYYGLRDYGLPPVLWPEISFSPMSGLPPLHVPEQVCCLGLEKDIWSYVGHLVLVFREVKRAMRDDGVLWLNLGDSYNGGGTHHGDKNAGLSKSSTRQQGEWTSKVRDLKPKDLMLIPARVALALQADGWYLRSDVIWHKPNPMPESVTDRPTKAHEYVFLLSKSERYFYDAEAIREPNSPETQQYFSKYNAKEFTKKTDRTEDLGKFGQTRVGAGSRAEVASRLNPAGRNRRTVWTVATQSYEGAHFATFPTKLIEPMILASTSEYGACGECGAQWMRVVEKEREYDHTTTRAGKSKEGPYGNQTGDGAGTHDIRHGVYSKSITTGFRPSCQCNAPTVPAVVLDPFAGSGTTLEVAIANRRNAIGIDANPTYAEELAPDRLNGTQIKLV